MLAYFIIDRSEMNEAKNATQLIDKTTRNRIFNSRYWKEECFALNAETFIDKAVMLKCIGGLYGGAKKPTKFLCLLFKMLQMGLSEDIVLVYLGEKEYKYLNALALLYLRLTLKAPKVHELLEPFYVDNRKLRVRNSLGRYELTYIDQFVDELLTSEICLGLTLPFIPRRLALEINKILDPRRSLIEEELNAEVQGIKE
jgi:pre-mRNA-splicing factor 38A